jgi:DNA-binding NtrC family response regulator
VKAIKLGAYEYVVKPFVVADVLTLIERALEKGRLVKEVVYLRNELERHKPFERMVGKDKKMRAIFDLISTISQSDGTVLVQGESGTGKELVARAIHNRSPRNGQPFVVINCAAIPSGLMESELFGYYKGAFTGASRTTMGKLEIANRGTVFLDDVNTLDLNMQAKLLRVIQERELERLGGTKVIKIDVRFVAASNRDLNKLISEEQFREDLYYRLNVFPIKLPPLRDRKADIPILLDYFLERHAKKTGKPLQGFSEKAINSLMRYDWPGNVREIENLVERLSTISTKAVIDVEDMSSNHIGLEEFKGMKLKAAVKAFEKKYISEVLEGSKGSRKKAAEALGIHRNTLLMKMNDLDIQAK